MTSLKWGSLVLGALGLVIGGAACGDDTGAGGSGGAETTTGATTATTTSSTSTGMTGDCTAISLDLATADAGFWAGPVAPGIDGADPDEGDLVLAEGATGNISFSMPSSIVPCFSEGTDNCLVVVADIPEDPMAPAGKFYFAESGTIALGSTTGPYYIAGSLQNVRLVEATFDDNGDVTVVPNGSCLTIADQAFAFEPPVVGWTCNPTWFADAEFCDCQCGAYDTDCDNAALPVFPCEDGQTCGATSFACEGVPSAWTCPADQYDGGAGNGCDCNCGTTDPDCDLPAEPVDGCQVGEVCSSAGTCFPSAWTCPGEFYGTADGCDCGCGALDPDCTDALVGSCDYCDGMGSCNVDMCPGTINATNNATCN